ncbi:hypothetical protein V8E54_000330 [Elaphomyces granulatus]
MSPRPRTQVEAFIDETPGSKLESEDFGDTPKSLHEDRNFKMMKYVTTREWILKVVIKKETEIHKLQKFSGRGVSTVYVPVGGGWTPQEIRDKLLENLVL